METDAGRRSPQRKPGHPNFEIFNMPSFCFKIKLWHKEFSFSKRVNEQLGTASGLLQLAGGSLCGYLGKQEILKCWEIDQM